MFTEDKVTEIFCIADDFCIFLNAMMDKYTIEATKKRKYPRDGTFSKALDYHNPVSQLWLSLPEAFLQAASFPFPETGFLQPFYGTEKGSGSFTGFVHQEDTA